MAALKEGGKISTNDMATSHHRQCLPETKKKWPKNLKNKKIQKQFKSIYEAFVTNEQHNIQD